MKKRNFLSYGIAAAFYWTVTWLWNERWVLEVLKAVGIVAVFCLSFRFCLIGGMLEHPSTPYAERAVTAMIQAFAAALASTGLYHVAVMIVCDIIEVFQKEDD